jgi:dUTP pyrophosphatase
MTTVLSKKNIQKLIERKPPLVENCFNIDEQLQPNGFDLTLQQIAALHSRGTIGVSNSQRVLSDLSTLNFDESGFIDLTPGSYTITYNEIVHIPTDVMALATPRSSILRCGVTINTAVWDAGYSGRSQSLMVVYNPHGFRLQKNARVLQLIFFKLTGETEGYKGIYQGENT